MYRSYNYSVYDDAGTATPAFLNSSIYADNTSKQKIDFLKWRLFEEENIISEEIIRMLFCIYSVTGEPLKRLWIAITQCEFGKEFWIDSIRISFADNEEMYWEVFESNGLMYYGFDIVSFYAYRNNFSVVEAINAIFENLSRNETKSSFAEEGAKNHWSFESAPLTDIDFPRHFKTL